MLAAMFKVARRYQQRQQHCVETTEAPSKTNGFLLEAFI